MKLLKIFLLACMVMVTGIYAAEGSQPNILWHNSTTGAVKFMPINNMIPENTLSVVDSSNTNLLPKGIGDFTGDDKVDILFHNQNSGNLRIWEMDGTSKVNNIQVLGSSNTNLKIAGVGDFDGDGDNDIATFNTNSGSLRMWVMEGTKRVANKLVLTGANTNLVPRGAGDMNGDSIPDIVLRNNNSGKVRVWTMNSDFTREDNIAVTSSSNTNLELRGVVDINNDGNNDILNYNTNTGKLRAWLMDGDLNIIENAEIARDLNLGWSVRGGGEMGLTDPQCAGDQQPDNGICFEGKFTDFSSVVVPPGETVLPETGATILRYNRYNSNDYIEITGTEVAGVPSEPLTKVESVIDGIYFSAWFSNGKMTKLIYDDWEMDIDETGFTINERNIVSLAKYLALATEQNDVDCSIGKTDYEELYEEANTRLQAAVDTAEIIILMPLFNNLTIKVAEIEQFKQFMHAILKTVMPEFDGLIDLRNYAKNALENYEKACGPCKYEVIIEDKTACYDHFYLPIQDEINNVLSRTPQCPLTGEGNVIIPPYADSTYRLCGYPDGGGHLEAEVYFQNGEFHGMQFTLQDGKIIQYGQWSHGKRSGLNISKAIGSGGGLFINRIDNYFYTGNKHLTIRYTEYDSSFSYEEVQRYGNIFKLNGNVVDFDANGSVKTVKEYIEGSLVKYMFFNTFTKQLIRETPYVNNQVHGNMKVYSALGELEDCLVYNNNIYIESCME